MAPKQLAKQVIESLPEDVNMDEIIHALYVNVKFNRGLREIQDGKGVSHEAAKQRLQKWLR